jgi:hypothetical protein
MFANDYCYENRALIPSTFRPKPNLVETTKAFVPVVTPYFYSSCWRVVVSLILYNLSKEYRSVLVKSSDDVNTSWQV